MLMKVKSEILLLKGKDTITTIAITPDLRYIVSGSKDKDIAIFDFNTKEKVHLFEKAHRGVLLESMLIVLAPVTSLQVSPDGRYIISGSEDKSIRMFDLHKREKIYSFDNYHESSIQLSQVSL
jgi:FOG: WD40 repeat